MEKRKKGWKKNCYIYSKNIDLDISILKILMLYFTFYILHQILEMKCVYYIFETASYGLATLKVLSRYMLLVATVLECVVTDGL